MSTAHPVETSTDDRRTVVGWIAGVAVAGVGLSALYAVTGLGVPCPLRGLTGWDCPLCGGTRMGAALLAGDPVAAFSYNPVVLIALPFAIVVGVLSVVELAAGRRGQLVAAVRRWAGRAPVRITGGRLVIGVAVVALAWVLFRNLVLGPLP